MIPFKVMAFILFVFVMGATTGAIFNGSSTYTASDSAAFQSVSSANGLEVSTGGSSLSLVKMSKDFFTTGLPRALMWDYPQLDGNFAFVRLILVVAISGPILYELAMALVFAIQGIITRFAGG